MTTAAKIVKVENNCNSFLLMGKKQRLASVKQYIRYEKLQSSMEKNSNSALVSRNSSRFQQLRDIFLSAPLMVALELRLFEFSKLVENLP